MPDDTGASADVLNDHETSTIQPGEAAAEDSGHTVNADSPRRWAEKKRRLEFLEDLIRNLDILAYAEIATVYYLDNSFLRFALRSLIQLLYLLPRSSTSPTALLPEPPLHSQPQIGAILAANLFCLFCHLWFAAPEAGEATRGYLHGGLMVDFVGQQGPSSKIRLSLLDVAILGLQILGLVAGVKRKALIGGTKGSGADASAESARTDGEGGRAEGQDHDAEERGILRRPPSPSSSRDAAERSMEDGTSSRTPTRTWAMADLLASGQTVIAELYIWDTLREQHNAYTNAIASSDSATASVNPELAEVLRRRGWRVNLPPFRS